MTEIKSESKEDKHLVLSLKFFILLFLAVFWATFFPVVIFGYIYFTIFPFSFTLIDILLLIPLGFILYGMTLISSIIVTKIGFWIVHKRVAPPQLGVFKVSMDEPQVRAYFIKGNIKNIGRWLFYLFDIQFLRKSWLRICGVKIGRNVKLSRHTQDEEFIEIGDNTFLSKQTIISGHLMDQTTITFNKTVIGKNVLMDNISGSVGGEVGDNSIFLKVTGAMKGQICKGNAVYQGVPCKKVRENDLSDAEIKAMKQEIRKIDKTDFIKEKNAPIKISKFKIGIMKVAIILSGMVLGSIVPSLYSLIFSFFYSPTNLALNILLLLTIPLVIIIAIGFFILGSVIMIKILLLHYGIPIPEGLYELDDPKARIFKMQYILRMFGVQIFHKTPFRVGDTFAMRFWGNVKFGRNIVLQDAVVDPQYLEIGDNTILAAGSRVHTHDLVDGKLFIKSVKIGKDVLIGAYGHIKPGVEIMDRSVLAVAAWMRKNLKTKRPALWVGKPAVEIPLDFNTKSSGFKRKIVD